MDDFFEHAVFKVSVFLNSLLSDDSEFAFFFDNINPNDTMKKNVENIISDRDDALIRLTDLLLFDNIVVVLNYYNSNEKGKIIEFDKSFNLFLSFYDEIIGVSVREGLVMKNGMIKAFCNSEELRRYLYHKAGFYFQSREDVSPLHRSEIVDPLAIRDSKAKFLTLDSFCGFLNNPNCVFLIKNQYQVPKKAIKENKRSIGQ